MNSPPTPSTFFLNELRQALAEESFGITSSAIIAPKTTLQASAAVTLLEGKTIAVTVSARGYHIGGHSTDRIFETLPALLQSVSKLYEKRRHEVLVKKLEALRHT